MRFSMLCTFTLVLLILGHPAPCAADPPIDPSLATTCAGVATSGLEVEAVRRLELRGARVNVEGWSVEEASAFFAPDFISVQPDGNVKRLDSVMASFVDGHSRGWARSFELMALEVRVFDCTAAVVVGVAQVRPLAAAVDARPRRIRFLNVWRRQDGKWLYWANQFVPLESGSADP